jgi:hypothetical protein
MYEFKYRFDDPQIGRFWQIDPLASKYEYNSAYAFSEDKVTGSVELEGLEQVEVNSPAARAYLRKNVQRDLSNAASNARQAVSVTVTVGATIGVHASVAGTNVKLEGSGPTVSVTANGAGNVSFEGSLAGATRTVQNANGLGVKSEVKAGVVEIKGGKIESSLGKISASGSLGVESEGRGGSQPNLPK